MDAPHVLVKVIKATLDAAFNRRWISHTCALRFLNDVGYPIQTMFDVSHVRVKVIRTKLNNPFSRRWISYTSALRFSNDVEYLEPGHDRRLHECFRYSWHGSVYDLNNLVCLQVRLEGRRPDKIFEIRISRQNERTIRYWWIAFCDAGEKYHLTKMNCCHVVVNALEAGAFEFEPNEISVMTPPANIMAKLVARIGFRPRSSGELLISTMTFALDMLRTQITLYLLCYLVGLDMLDMDL